MKITLINDDTKQPFSKLKLAEPVKYTSKKSNYVADIYNIKYNNNDTCIKFSNKFISIFESYEYGKERTKENVIGMKMRLKLNPKEKALFDKIHETLQEQYKGTLRKCYIESDYTDNLSGPTYSMFVPINDYSLMKMTNEFGESKVLSPTDETFLIGSHKADNLKINLRCIFHSENNETSKITMALDTLIIEA